MNIYDSSKKQMTGYKSRKEPTRNSLEFLPAALLTESLLSTPNCNLGGLRMDLANLMPPVILPALTKV